MKRASERSRALALDRLLRRDEALLDWDRAVDLSSDEEKPDVQMPRAASLAGTGRCQEAVEQANQLVPGASASVLYDAACVHSLSSIAAKEDPQLQEQYAARAIELLRAAKAGGLFRNPAMIEYVGKDYDLKPLREWADFQQFVAELRDPEPADDERSHFT